MDVLLSLPIVSYFLGPSVTSWSTSLNLLFFYMTWTTLILSHSPLKVELFGILILRLFLWLIPSTIFLTFDSLLPTVAESIKTGGASALPPTRDRRYMARTFFLALFNLLLSTALEAGSSLAWGFAFHSQIFKASTALPLPWQLVKHIALLLLGREVLTYYIHSHFLHGSQYRTARLHRSYDHARKAPPFSLALFADHPVPFLLHRFVPLYLPALALRPHLLVYFLYVALCTLEETFAMSGYSTIPGIVMGGITRRTAAHYASGGECNYGAWGVLDWAHGTTKGRDVIDDVRDEADKHAVKDRGEKAAGDGVAALRGGIDDLKRGGRSRGKKKSAEESS